MKKLEIKSYESVGNIRLGEKREDVRKSNGVYKEFKKTRFSNNSTDDFGKFHVYYNDNNIVIAIEFFRESELSFHGTLLFQKTLSELKALLKDSEIVEDSCSIIYKTLGFAIYSSNKKEIESITVFCKGYYD